MRKESIELKEMYNNIIPMNKLTKEELNYF